MFGYHIGRSAFNGRFYLQHAGNSVPVKTLKQAWEIAEQWDRDGIPKPEPVQ